MPVRLSVVVPAHDEASVITRCLDSIYADFPPGDVDVVVVANGCTDSTADTAREHPRRPRVLELERGSKTGALNAGDAVLGSFPRAYVDGDVRLCPGALAAVVDALDAGALAAAPRPVFELRGRPWAVKAFYRSWQRLPFLTQRPVGNGVYAVSVAGRARFDRFPDVIADDLFVLRLFALEERAVPDDACFVVETPRSLRYLLRVRRRVYAGNRQLAALSGERAGGPGAGSWRGVRAATTARTASEVAVYVGVNALARFQAARPGGADTVWERDDSTR